MIYQQYRSYVERRWHELGVPAATARVQERFGGITQQQINALFDSPRSEDHHRGVEIEHAFLAVQCPPFFLIVGELHHALGHRDVGAGRKVGGLHWHGMATDIIVLKPTTGAGQVIEGPVQIVDPIFAMGGPEPRVTWDILAPNPDRTWMVPPVPAGGEQPPPGPTDPPPPPMSGGLEARVAALEAQLADVLRYGSKAGLRLANGFTICIEQGNRMENEEAIGHRFESRQHVHSWETVTFERPE